MKLYNSKTKEQVKFVQAVEEVLCIEIFLPEKLLKASKKEVLS